MGNEKRRYKVYDEDLNLITEEYLTDQEANYERTIMSRILELSEEE